MDKSPLGEVARRALTSTRALSLLGVSIWVPLAMLRVFVRQVPVGGYSFNATFGTALVSGCAALLATWGVRQTVLRRQTAYRASIARTAAAYLLLILIIGTCQFAAERLFHLTGGPSVLRLLGSLVSLYLIAAVLDYFDSYRERLVQLVAEQQRLIDIRTANANALQSLRSQVVHVVWEQVRRPWQVIVSELDRYQRDLGMTADQLHASARAIRVRLLQPIRTLSYEVQEARGTLGQVDRPEPAARMDQRPPQRGGLDWRKVISAIPSGVPFQPVPTGLTVFVLSIINAEYLTVPLTLLNTVLLTSLTLGLLVLANRIVLPVIRRSGPATQWLLFASVLIGISAVLSGLFSWLLALTGNPYLWSALGGIPLSSTWMLIWAALGAVTFRVSETEDRLRQAIELRRHETVALESEVASVRHQVAHVLHGEVQTMLTSAAFRLDIVGEQIENGLNVLGVHSPAVAVADALGTMSTAATRIDAIESMPALPSVDTGATPRVLREIEDLRVTWSGITEITVTIDTATALLLDARVNDASLTPAVVDIVREAILNAVRHANAGVISVEIVAVDGWCQITIVNDGSPPDPFTTPGLGHTMLDELGCIWSLTPADLDGAVLRIDLPLLMQ